MKSAWLIRQIRRLLERYVFLLHRSLIYSRIRDSFGLGKTSSGFRVYAPFAKSSFVDMPAALLNKLNAENMVAWLHQTVMDSVLNLNSGWAPEVLSGARPLLIAYVNPADPKYTAVSFPVTLSFAFNLTHNNLT